MANEKNFYVIIRGHIFPAVTQSWAVAQPLVNGFPNNKHRSCTTFAEARSILEAHGFTDLWFLEGMTDGPSLRSRKTKNGITHAEATYSVAKGKGSGLYSVYSLDVKPRTDYYSGACHKKLSDKTRAADFIQALEETEQRLHAFSIHTEPTV